MSASERTPHLHLCQYTETDRPSYVTDYTDDMGKIDTGFNLAQGNALLALQHTATLQGSVTDLTGRVQALEQNPASSPSVDCMLLASNPQTVGSVLPYRFTDAVVLAGTAFGSVLPHQSADTEVSAGTASGSADQGFYITTPGLYLLTAQVGAKVEVPAIAAVMSNSSVPPICSTPFYQVPSSYDSEFTYQALLQGTIMFGANESVRVSFYLDTDTRYEMKAFAYLIKLA